MGNLLKYILVGIAAIIAIKIALTVIGFAIGLTITLLIIGAPVALVGYVVYRVFGKKKRDQPQLSDADRKWLES